MGPKSTLALGFAILAASLALLLSTEEWGLESGAAGEVGSPGATSAPGWPYLLEDPHDRFADQQYGYWLPAGVRPYLDEFSPYPQLTTWVMGAPYLFFAHGIERGEPIGSIRAATDVLVANGVPLAAAEEFARAGATARKWQAIGRSAPPRDQVFQRLASGSVANPTAVRAALERAWRAVDARDAALERDRQPYGDAHQVLMGLFFALDLVLLVLCLRELGAPPWWALAMLLPGTLYFGFNRHESFVMSFALGALLLALRGQRLGAGALLGLATMAKIWPGFLFPLFASYGVHREREQARANGATARWGPLLVRHVVLPGAAAAGVCLLVNAVTFVHGGGGVEAVTYVYRYLLGTRDPNHSSVLALMTDPERWAWFAPESRDALERAFKVLQVLPPLVLALIGVRSREALIHGCAVTGLSAAIWSEFFSPQWVWWSLPFALLIASRFWPYRWLVPLVAAGIYVQLPLVFHHELERMQTTGKPNEVFWQVLSARAAVLFLFLLVALAGFALARRERAAPRAPAPSENGA